MEPLQELMSDILEQILTNGVMSSLDPGTQVVLSFLHDNIGLEFMLEGGVDLDDMPTFR